MILFKSSKYNLNKLKDFDFGCYLHMVESNIYEVETVISRSNKVKRKIKNKYISDIFKNLFFISCLVACPLILIVMAYLSDKSYVIEYLLYGIWLMFGIWQAKKYFDFIKELYINKKKKNERINKALKFGIKYGLVVVNAFYNKSENFENVFKDLSEDEVQEVVDGLNLLEFDLTTFEEIAYKNQKCNEQPAILEDDYYQDGRDLSREFLERFFHFRIGCYIK